MISESKRKWRVRTESPGETRASEGVTRPPNPSSFRQRSREGARLLPKKRLHEITVFPQISQRFPVPVRAVTVCREARRL